MFNAAHKTMLCMTCFRDTPPETRIHCVDIDTAYLQCGKKLDRALVVSFMNLGLILIKFVNRVYARFKIQSVRDY